MIEFLTLQNLALVLVIGGIIFNLFKKNIVWGSLGPLLFIAISFY